MNVVTAVRLFSKEVIAALEFMCASGDLDFANVQTTIEFVKVVKKWWEVIY
jgi:hypothetical protein